MVRLAPAGVQQNERSASVQHQIVVNLVLMHVVLLGISVIGRGYSGACMHHHIGVVSRNRWIGMKRSRIGFLHGCLLFSAAVPLRRPNGSS